MAIPFNLPSNEMLLALINQDNDPTLDTDLTFAMVQFSVPSASTNPNRNTQVTVSPAANANVAGQKVVFYDRLDMEIFFTGGIDYVPESEELIETTADVLARINTAYGLGMTTADIIVEPVAGNVGDSWNLRANPNSYLWFGEVEVRIAAPAIDLDAVIQVTELTGFTYPDPE